MAKFDRAPMSAAQILEEMRPGLRDKKERLRILKRIHDALKRLERRGIVERVRRGLYKLRDSRILAALRVVDSSGGRGKEPKETGRGGAATSVCGGCVGGFGSFGVVGGLGVVGPLFDNVRGFGFGGYVCGDRGRVRGLGELVGFSRVSYAEVLWRVSGLRVDGQVVIYTNVGQDGSLSVRVEWRPPRGFVRRNGVAGVVRYAWVMYARAAVALLRLLLEAPAGVLDWVGPRVLALAARLVGRLRRLRAGGRIRGVAVLREALGELAAVLGCTLLCPGDGRGPPP